ncbi:MAG: glycosyltransferase [Prevotellaceae bacterium]|nr:glycosyltransferase [Candidatus Colivivens equi]
MKISVIVPVYNTEEHIQICIDTILSQTYTDLELLLVDDGSTDKSGVICDEYANKDKRIRVFHKKNEGVSSARNLGIEEAVGDYLHFVDADDIVPKRAYEYLNSVIHEYSHPDIICFKSKKNSVKPVENRSVKECFYHDMHQGIKEESFLSTVWCKVFKREFVLNSKVRFYPIMYAEDVDFVWNLLQHEGTLLVSPAVLYSYSTTPGSVVNNRELEHVRRTIDSFVKLNMRIKSYASSFEDCPSAIKAFTHKYKVLFNRIISLPLKYEEIKEIFHQCSAIGIQHLYKDKWVLMSNYFYHHPLLYYMAQIPILNLYFWSHSFQHDCGDFIDRRLKPTNLNTQLY